MDFGELLKDTWERFVVEIVALVLFTLVGALLSLTVVLIPTVAAGWVRGILAYVRSGEPPSFDELWSFEHFLPTLLLLVLAGVGISLGFLLFFVPGVILSVWWMYALWFLVDQELGVLEAFTASKNAVVETGFMNHLVVLLIVSVLTAAGGSLSGLGALVTTPFSLVFLALVYRDLPGAEPDSGRARYASFTP